MLQSLSEKLSAIPTDPGVYLFKDTSGLIIYVGKAKNLKSRVGSYFQVDLTASSKTAALVSRINDIDFIKVETEFDALILEAELIKKHKPKYNIVQKDDKTYLYIVIRKEVLAHPQGGFYKCSKVITARETQFKKGDKVFGPYPDSSSAKFIVKTTRKMIGFRDCSVSKYGLYSKKSKQCLYGDLQLCQAPCVNNSQVALSNYEKNVKKIARILSGKRVGIVKTLIAQRKRFAHLEQYEAAAETQALLEKYEYVRHRFRMPEEYIHNPKLIDDLALESLRELVKLVPILKEPPKRIECFDIANISGKQAVGSMVVMENGQITKREYRRFKIKILDTPNDVKMLQEVLSRRLEHSQSKNHWPMPDLLVVDGGKPQVSAVSEVLAGANLAVPLIGLAKKEETIVYFDKTVGRLVELSFPKTNSGLNLLIRLRGEAHRFAQAYHHKLRLKSMLL